MNVTSAIPIMSAAAVAAVRPGLRWAFRSAILPAAPPDAPSRDADDARERADEPRREHRDADEQRQDAEPEQGEPVADGDVVGERPVAEREDGQRDDRARDVRREAGEAAARHRRALPHGGDRRHPGRADRREEAGDERHERPDEQRDDDRARREDRVGLRQLEVERLEERLQPDGEAEAAEQARRSTR